MSTGPTAVKYRILPGLVLVSMIGACSNAPVEFQNRQAAHELERSSAIAGSPYVGWRLFQDRCAECHNSNATGTRNAPNLLPIVGAMGSRQFADVVLRRYKWDLYASKGKETSKNGESVLDDVLGRREPLLVMPKWQGEPSVNAHVMDLYVYLAARAQGSLGPGPPAR